MSTATPRRAAALYDGRDLVALVQQHADGWHVLMRGRDDIGVVLPTRAMAIAMANARKNEIAAAPIAGEREADAERINRIRSHQQHAEARRERSGRTSRSVPSSTPLILRSSART